MLIAYPFHVTHRGVAYAPNQPIEVEDATYYVAGGAVVIDCTPVNPAAEEKPKQKRAYNRKKVNGGE